MSGNGIARMTASKILHSEDTAADVTVITNDLFPVFYRSALKDSLAGRVVEDTLWARAFASSRIALSAYRRVSQSPHTATTVRFQGDGEPIVRDSPFIEGNEGIGDYAESTHTHLDEVVLSPATGPIRLALVLVRPSPLFLLLYR